MPKFNDLINQAKLDMISLRRDFDLVVAEAPSQYDNNEKGFAAFLCDIRECTRPPE